MSENATALQVSATTSYAPTSTKNFMNNYPLVLSEGKYTMKVRSSNKFFNDRLGRDVTIVNLYGLFERQVSPELMEKINNQEPIDVVNDVKTTMSFQSNKVVEYATGELVNVTVGYVYSKSAGKDVLAVTSISAIPATKPSTASWGSLVAKGKQQDQDSSENQEDQDERTF